MGADRVHKEIDARVDLLIRMMTEVITSTVLTCDDVQKAVRRSTNHQLWTNVVSLILRWQTAIDSYKQSS